MNLKLDSDTNDLVLDDTGNLALVTDPVEEVAQRLRYRLQTIQGTWPLDLSMGVDYLGEVLVKAPDLALVRSEFVRVIGTTEGVTRIESLELDYDAPDRHLALTFRVIVGNEILEATGNLVTDNELDLLPGSSALGSMVLIFKRLGRIGGSTWRG